MCRSYGTLLCKSYRNSIHFIKTYQRAVGSAYIVGMDFNPSYIMVICLSAVGTEYLICNAKVYKEQ